MESGESKQALTSLYVAYGRREAYSVQNSKGHGALQAQLLYC